MQPEPRDLPQAALDVHQAGVHHCGLPEVGAAVRVGCMRVDWGAVDGFVCSKGFTFGSRFTLAFWGVREKLEKGVP